jgi:hypothetical protein
VKKRTRSGKGSTPQGNETNLKPLSPSYIKARQKMNLSPDTSPSKSNLTKSGDMLDDITANVKASNDKINITIGFNSAKERKKAGYVSDERPFMNLTKAEEKQLADATEQVAYEEALKAIKNIKV